MTNKLSELASPDRDLIIELAIGMADVEIGKGCPLFRNLDESLSDLGHRVFVRLVDEEGLVEKINAVLAKQPN